MVGVRPTPMRWASPAYMLLLVLSVLAFWPGYLAQPMASIGGWTHFHAAVGTLWLLMLVAQPIAVQANRRRLHRIIGRSSQVLRRVLGWLGRSGAVR